MRPTPNSYLESRRVRRGPLASDSSIGNNGFFLVERNGQRMKVCASDGGGWEHVSVSCEHRCPTWHEMAWVKSQFWNPDECVVQFHPPESEYVNNHPNCLHMWKKVGTDMPTPPHWMVGIKEKRDVLPEIQP